MRHLVAIPVFNEALSLGPVFAGVCALGVDVLAVDDGSTDGSSALLDQLADGRSPRSPLRIHRHAANLGYGAALCSAFRWARERRYDWVTTMDCDGQHDPGVLQRLWDRAAEGEWDIVSGSRYAPGSEVRGVAAPGDRASINRVLTEDLNARFGLGLTDAFCGMKAHRVVPTGQLELDEPGYAFPLQLWVRIAAAGLRVCESPVPRVYTGEARTFGGGLDDPAARLAKYRAVLDAEFERAGLAAGGCAQGAAR